MVPLFHAALLVLVPFAAFSMLFAALVAALRDWMDAPQGVHLLAIALMCFGTLPCLLLPLDRARFGDAVGAMVNAYDVTRFMLWPLIFVVGPAALTAAAAYADPRRRRSAKTRACLMGALGALVGISLSAASPYLALHMPGKLLSRQAWVQPEIAALLKAHASRVPRAILDGPLAAWLLGGGVILALHAAAGAIALPVLLLPAPRKGSRAEQVHAHAAHPREPTSYVHLHRVALTADS